MNPLELAMEVDLKEYEEKNKKTQEEFIQEVCQNDLEWVKERRLEYLVTEKGKLEKIVTSSLQEINDAEYQLYFGEAYYEIFLSPLVKKWKQFCSLIKRWETPESDTDQNKITESDVALAKEVEIGSILKMEREERNRAWAKCIFHDEKTPSLCWYKNTNTFYCFGCCKGGDAIELAMALYECNFLQAVRILINK